MIRLLRSIPVEAITRMGFLVTLLGPVWAGLSSAELVSAQRRRLYDELCRRVDGRRDVDSDGDRRAGGGPAGRGDYQAVQKQIVTSRPACEVNC